MDGDDVPRVSDYRMLEVDEVIEILLGVVGDLEVGEEVIESGEGCGRVLSMDVISEVDIPPFRASVKDGYAVVCGEGVGVFDVVGEVTAGRRPEVVVGGGKVAYVPTGAAVPDSADAVVQVEWTRKGTREGTVELVRTAEKVGHDIRPVGTDLQRGQKVLEKGDLLGSAEIGLLAACNVPMVEVGRKPIVSVLSTGDELVSMGETPTFGQIVDSNRPMLLAAIEASGARSLDLGIARDNETDVINAFTRAFTESDVVVTSGGVSMGNKDFIKPILEKFGKVRLCSIRLSPVHRTNQKHAHIYVVPVEEAYLDPGRENNISITILSKQPTLCTTLYLSPYGYLYFCLKRQGPHRSDSYEAR